MRVATPATIHLDDADAPSVGRRRLIEATREAATWRKPQQKRRRKRTVTTG